MNKQDLESAPTYLSHVIHTENVENIPYIHDHMSLLHLSS